MPRQLEIIAPHAPRAEAIWRDLERTACPAYFLTWGWVENWLAMLPRSEAPGLAVIRDAGEITGAFDGMSSRSAASSRSRPRLVAVRPTVVVESRCE